MEVGRALSRDIATGERAEKDLDAFISRRDKQRRETEGERAEEAMWVASEKLAEGRRRAENRLAWRRHHLEAAERLRGVLGALIAKHEESAARLTETNDERKTA